MPKLTVYQTGPDGTSLYQTFAHALPLSPGRYNVPYGAYEDAPPTAPDGQVAVRDTATNSWNLVEDYRARTL